jgi:hypothetical protein
MLRKNSELFWGVVKNFIKKFFFHTVLFRFMGFHGKNRNSYEFVRIHIFIIFGCIEVLVVYTNIYIQNIQEQSYKNMSKHTRTINYWPIYISNESSW